MNQDIYMCIPITNMLDFQAIQECGWEKFKAEARQIQPNNPNVIKTVSLDTDKTELIKADSVEGAFEKLLDTLWLDDEKEEEREWTLENYIIIPVPNWIRKMF